MVNKPPMTRSENMSKIKSKNTIPEIYIRKLLYNNGFRYRLNYKQVSGKPDIYIRKYNVAIFVNGCFWHMHENCKLSSIPKNNHDFWEQKLLSNVKRDEVVYEALTEQGLRVLVIWGCTIKEMLKSKQKEAEIVASIINFLQTNIPFKEI
jgi:DNA mismatch endonuclease (patch repair protein)